MKHTIINTLLFAAMIAAALCVTFAPWWAVWFICFPVVYGCGVALLKRETNYITEL